MSVDTGQTPKLGCGIWVLPVLLLLSGPFLGQVAADQITIVANKDNTIYSEFDDRSNGAGSRIFAGRTNEANLRRALVAFDVVADLPAGSTVDSVTFQLYVSRTVAGSENVSLHLLLTDWGEGTSDAPGQEGKGRAATDGDATWKYTFYDTSDPSASPAWTSPGGDFVAGASGTTSVGPAGSFYTWGSTGSMVADVQSWLDSPAGNYGWIVIGNEGADQTAKRFDSRTNSDATHHPAITVDFTPPVVDGACCFGDGTCLVLTSADCSTQGGSYQGDGTDCTPNPCSQPGACCLPNGTCVDVIEEDCLAQSGTFQGEGTSCATTDCIGACCLLSGTCVETTLDDCNTQSGTYQSFGSSCTPNPCAQPEGACCFSDGSCLILSAGACSGQGGIYQGDGTVCTPNPCPQPGACCFDDGSCTEILEADCTTSGGVFQGEGITCTPNPCPQPGACCFNDGSCTVVFAADCSTAGGAYQGDGTTCTPNPCPQPGACCFNDGSCTIQLAADCSTAGGTYQGEGTVCTPDLCPVILEPYVDPLPVPALAQPVSGQPGGVASYEMAIRQFSQQLHRDLPPTTVWGFGDGPTNGAYPGPTILAKTGEPVTVTWINDLRDSGGNLLTSHHLEVDTCPHGADDDSPRTVIHLHGGHVPEAVDGYPEATFLPGSSVVYTYPNNQHPGTLWYHDHALGITRLNVIMGLAGGYLVTDDFEQALGLPSGAYEMPLIVQDRVFNPDGSFNYPATWQEDFFGDTLLVNGMVWPYLNVDQGKYRFRLLNGSTTRVYTFAMSPATPFIQIGTEGGLLPAPVTVNEITLSTGERADVIIDFAGFQPNDEIILTNSAPAPFPGTPGVGVIPNIMKFVVQNQAGHTDPVPATLRPLDQIPESESVLTRDFELRKFSESCAGSHWLINGLRWDDITEYPVLGTTEIWRFINRSGMSHPMHMHLVLFQVLDRQDFEVVDEQIVPIGSPVPPDPNEAGWKDTVTSYPQQITRVIARFEDYTGRFAYHCHILEHEDHEMMRQFETICIKGDTNQDTLVNGSDIGAFVDTMISGGEIGTAAYCATDMNSNGVLEFGQDTPLFVDCLLGVSCP